jgi:hypothetical protein
MSPLVQKDVSNNEIQCGRAVVRKNAVNRTERETWEFSDLRVASKVDYNTLYIIIVSQ